MTDASLPASSQTSSGAKDAVLACLVVHDDLVVAHDLRDILLDQGATEVTILRSAELDKTAANDRPAIVLTAVALGDVVAQSVFSQWSAQGTAVVLLDSDAARHTAERAGFHVVPAPFRSEDVAQVLSKLGASKAPTK